MADAPESGKRNEVPEMEHAYEVLDCEQAVLANLVGWLRLVIRPAARSPEVLRVA